MKSEKLIRNKNPAGFGTGSKHRWMQRKKHIATAVEALGDSAWSFFVKQRAEGYKAGKCVQESYEDAFELTLEQYGQPKEPRFVWE